MAKKSTRLEAASAALAQAERDYEAACDAASAAAERFAAEPTEKNALAKLVAGQQATNAAEARDRARQAVADERRAERSAELAEMRRDLMAREERVREAAARIVAAERELQSAILDAAELDRETTARVRAAAFVADELGEPEPRPLRASYDLGADGVVARHRKEGNGGVIATFVQALHRRMQLVRVA